MNAPIASRLILEGRFTIHHLGLSGPLNLRMAFQFRNTDNPCGSSKCLTSDIPFSIVYHVYTNLFNSLEEVFVKYRTNGLMFVLKVTSDSFDALAM
jgi:hypothetical protein